MSLAVYFTVPGDPVGKGRPRVSTIGGNPRLYTPAKTAAWERQIAAACQAAMGSSEPSQALWKLTIDVRHRIPASWTKARKALAREGKIAPGKPDVDNVLKAILDACNGVLYVDDRQVTKVRIGKRYGEEPGIEVYAMELCD